MHNRLRPLRHCSSVGNSCHRVEGLPCVCWVPVQRDRVPTAVRRTVVQPYPLLGGCVTYVHVKFLTLLKMNLLGMAGMAFENEAHRHLDIPPRVK